MRASSGSRSQDLVLHVKRGFWNVGSRPHMRDGIGAFLAQVELAPGASSRCDRSGVGWGMCCKPLFARTGIVI